MAYRRVTAEDRIRIKDGLDAGLTNEEIGDKLGFHKSTIGREIKRNSGFRGYRPKQANRLSIEREFRKHGPTKLYPVLISKILERLELKWSTEQISNRLKYDGGPSVSPETIYKLIIEDKKIGGTLYKNLRRSNRIRKRRFPSEDRRGTIKGATPISKRGKLANKRSRVGDWERDKCSVKIERLVFSFLQIESLDLINLES